MSRLVEVSLGIDMINIVDSTIEELVHTTRQLQFPQAKVTLSIHCHPSVTS